MRTVLLGSARPAMTAFPSGPMRTTSKLGLVIAGASVAGSDAGSFGVVSVVTAGACVTAGAVSSSALLVSM